MDPTTRFVSALAAKSGDSALEVAKQETQTFLQKIIGPSAEAIGESFAVRHRERLFNNIVDTVARTREKLRIAGVDPKQVPLKIIHPLLEGVAVEEEPGVREMWANLLANAADPRGTNPVHSSYVSILKDFGPREVKFLDCFSRETEGTGRLAVDYRVGGFRAEQLMSTYAKAGLLRREYPAWPFLTHGVWNEYGAEIRADLHDYGEMIDILKRHEIIYEFVHLKPIDLREVFPEFRSSVPDNVEIQAEQVYKVTEFGYGFISACREPPLPTSVEE